MLAIAIVVVVAKPDFDPGIMFLATAMVAGVLIILPLAWRG